ncbi:MAG: hypothetical protein GY757_38335 [bacterium]|nr:hypothetical protein [bacterium]
MNSNGKIDIKALPKPQTGGGQGDGYTPPCDAWEESLLKIWSGVLQLPRETISTGDDFFRLGGHSLKAMMMITKIFDQWGVRIPLVEIFKKNTVANLAGYLRNIGKNDHTTGPLTMTGKNLVLLKQRKGKPNLFLIHDGSGEVAGYFDLCERLSGYNCWGIRSERLPAYAARNRTIESLAEGYIREIKSIQPGGPYMLAGWSLGGTIAFEMARRFERDGEKPGGLVLIDTKPPTEDTGNRMERFTLKSELQWLRKNSPRMQMAGELESAVDVDTLWQGVVDFAVSNGIAPHMLEGIIAPGMACLIPNLEGLRIDEFIRSLNLIRTLEKAGRDYIPYGKSRWKTYYISALRSGIKNRSHWDSYFVGKLSHHEVDADHFMIVKQPAVTELAEIFPLFSPNDV